MPTYEIPRYDCYVITVEAKDINDLYDKLNDDDQFLNCGSYAGSEFGDCEEIPER
jgi:hypothetical protein